MIRWRVREVAAGKGFRGPTELAERAHINKNTAVNLWHEQPLRIDRETLSKLCRTLECTPGDLLVFEESETHESAPESLAA